MSVELMLLLSEFKRHPLRVLHQMVFFIPVIFIGVFLILFSLMPNINQMLALAREPYVGFSVLDEADAEEGFTMCDGDLFKTYTLHDGGAVEVHTYPCTVYLPNALTASDYERTPFCDAEVVAGKTAASLGAGEALMTQQTALAAGIAVGDEFTLIVGDDDFEEAHTLVLAGVLMPRSAYGHLTLREGVILVNPGADAALRSSMQRQGSTVVFHADYPAGFQGVTLADEWEEAASFTRYGLTYAAISVLTFVLILVLLAKETAYLLRKRQSSLAVLCACGERLERGIRYMMLEELVILAASNIVAIVLARYVLMLPEIALPVSLGVAVGAFVTLLLVELLIVCVYGRKMRQRLGTRQLLALLARKGAEQWR